MAQEPVSTDDEGPGEQVSRRLREVLPGDIRDSLHCVYCGTPIPPRRGRGFPRRFCTKRCNRRWDRARCRRQARTWRRLVPELRELREDASKLVVTIGVRPEVADVLQRLASLDLTEE